MAEGDAQGVGALVDLNTTLQSLVKNTGLILQQLRQAPGWVAVPVTASSAGVAGQMAYDAGFLYICVSSNTWQRVAIATF